MVIDWPTPERLKFSPPICVSIDTACRDYADALQILGGKASITEACREWIKRNAVTLAKITVAAAVEQLKRQAITDGKSNGRQKQLAAALDRLADWEKFTPDWQAQLAKWLEENWRIERSADSSSASSSKKPQPADKPSTSRN